MCFVRYCLGKYGGFCHRIRLSIRAHLRRQRHIRQAQSLAEMPLPSIRTFLGSLGKYFFDKLVRRLLPPYFLTENEKT